MPAPLLRSLPIALDEIRRHPWRTLLAAQGMLWAVALTILPAAVLQGSRSQALEHAAELETDLVQISPEFSDRGAALKPPRESDLDEFDLPPELTDARLTAFRISNGRLATEDSGEIPARSDVRVWIVGADSKVFGLRRIELLAGRYPDLEPGSSVGRVVESALEEGLARKLLGQPEDPKGESTSTRDVDLSALVGLHLEIQWPSRDRAGASASLRLVSSAPQRIGRRADQTWLRIVGVVKDRSESTVDNYGFEKRREALSFAEPLLQLVGLTNNPTPWKKEGVGIYIPRIASPGTQLDWIMLQIDPVRVADLKEAAESFFIQKNRRVVLYTNFLLPILTGSEIGSYLRVHRYLFWLFLLVGLAVLTNILLLAGFRRRREIALRRAEGATRTDVFAQFLWEGWLVAGVGLILGVSMGMLLAWIRVLLDQNVAMAAAVPWSEVARSGVILTLAALLASSYPAWWASRFHPMTLFRRA